MSNAAIYTIVAIACLVGFIAVLANLVASLALVRTSSLTRFQKTAQLAIVWLLPFVGASLVLHLIGQIDRAAIPEWIPDTAINRYVLELLGIEGRVAERAAEHVVETSIISSISEHMSHHSSEVVTGGSNGGQ